MCARSKMLQPFGACIMHCKQNKISAEGNNPNRRGRACPCPIPEVALKAYSIGVAREEGARKGRPYRADYEL